MDVDSRRDPGCGVARLVVSREAEGQYTTQVVSEIA